MRRTHGIRADRGFTLVEVLVALLVMSLMAGMAWQALDGIGRTRAASESHVERTLRINSVIAQWEYDLLAVEDTHVGQTIAFDGSTLRFTRQAEGGVAVVAWSLRGGVWRRWASPAVNTAPGVLEQWNRSLQLLGNEPEQVRMLEGIAQWQVYFGYGGAWSNAQSTGNVRQGNNAGSGVPEGVRIVVSFGDAAAYTGTLTRDLRLGPQP